MKTQSDRTPGNETKAVYIANNNRQNNGKNNFKIIDNGPENIAKRNLQQEIDSSPKVKQLKAYQEMADGSPIVKQLKLTQEVANGNVIQRAVIRLPDGSFFSNLTNESYPSSHEATQAEFAYLERGRAAAHAPANQPTRQIPIYGAVPPPTHYGPMKQKITNLLRDRETGRMTPHQFQRAVLALDNDDLDALRNHPQLANIPDALDFLE